MYLIIWEYKIKAQFLAEFEKFYGPDGAWAELFKKDLGYLGTELIRDSSNSHWFLTIDRWGSAEEYDLFLAKYLDEYEALDARCSELTEYESLLGTYTPA